MVVALVGVAWPVLLAAAVVPAAQEWFARRRARRERLARAERVAVYVADADGRLVGRMRAEADRDGGERL